MAAGVLLPNDGCSVRKVGANSILSSFSRGSELHTLKFTLVRRAYINRTSLSDECTQIGVPYQLLVPVEKESKRWRTYSTMGINGYCIGRTRCREKAFDFDDDMMNAIGCFVCCWRGKQTVTSPRGALAYWYVLCVGAVGVILQRCWSMTMTCTMDSRNSVGAPMVWTKIVS